MNPTFRRPRTATPRRGAVQIALLAAALAPMAQAQECPTYPRPWFLANSPPTWLATGDVNGDALPDVAAAAGGVYAFVTTGPGLFGKARGVIPAIEVYQTAIADVNGDSNRDVVALVHAGSISTTVAVALGDGTGVFAPPIQLPFYSVSPGGVAVADLDGDADADILAASHGLFVFLGDGQGKFSDPIGHHGVYHLSNLELTDLDADGALDAVTASGSIGLVSVAMGDGKGGFLPARSFPAGGGAFSPVVADLNQDAFPDIAVVDPKQDRVLVMFGMPGGLHAPISFATGREPVSLAKGDFNGDGSFDLATANNDSADVTILLSDGQAAFSMSSAPAARFPTVVGAEDFDRDGAMDLAVGEGLARGFHILSGDGSGTFAKPQFLPIPSPAGGVIHDLNGDGRPDLAIAREDPGGVAIVENDGTGSFALAAVVPAGAGPRAVAAGDVNGDGLADLGVANGQDNTATILLALPAGGFSTPAGFPAGTGPRSIAMGDLDGDALSDLAVAAEDSKDLTILLSDGLGGVSASTKVDLTHAPLELELYDIDADGDLDVCLAREEPLLSTAVVLQNDGQGGFGAPKGYHGGKRPDAIEIGDMNGDGAPDLILSNPENDQVTMLYNDGQGGFPVRTVTYTDPSPRSIAVVDVDRDGMLDFAVLEPVFQSLLGTVATYRQEGFGVYAKERAYAATGPPTALLSGDLDDHAGEDLVVLHQKQHRVEVLLHQCPLPHVRIYGAGCAGSGGFVPDLHLVCCASLGTKATLAISGGLGGSTAAVYLGLSPASVPIPGAGACTLLVAPVLPFSLGVPLGGVGPGTGSADVLLPIPPSLPATSFVVQAFVTDPGAPPGFSTTAGLAVDIP